jgi:hypothetical protein
VLLVDDEARPGHDQDTDLVGGQGARHAEDRTAELIATLQEQLAEEREARRRADTIIAQLARANEEQARTIRELESPSEPPSEERGSPETPSESPASTAAPPEPEPPAEVRPWWRRMFGG